MTLNIILNTKWTKLFTFMLGALLMAPAFSDEFNDSVTRASCPVKSRSQSSFNNFFTAMPICSQFGKKEISKFDNDYCKTVGTCDYLASDKLDREAKEDKVFLDIKLKNYLLNKDLKVELDNYKSANSQRMMRMIAFSEKLPLEFKKQIKSCGPQITDSAVNADKCLISDSDFDSIAQDTINSKMFTASSDEVSTRQSRGESSAVMGLPSITKIVGGLLSSRSSQLSLADMAQTHLLSGVDSGSAGVTGLQFHPRSNINLLYVSEGLLKQQVDKSSIGIGGDSDKVLEAIQANIRPDTLQISNDAIKKQVIDILSGYGFLNFEKQDFIFGFNPKDIQQLNKDLTQAMSAIEFNANDFTSGGAGLLKKINQVRVNLANNYIQKNCESVDLNIGQVCAKVDQRLKTGKSLEPLRSLSSEELYDEMLKDWQSDQGKLSGVTKEDIERLKKIKNAGSKVYNTYLPLIFDKNICSSNSLSLGNLSDPSANAMRAQVLADTKKSSEVAALAVQTQAAEKIGESISSDSSLRKEYENMGITNFDYSRKADKLVSGSLDSSNSPNSRDNSLDQTDQTNSNGKLAVPVSLPGSTSSTSRGNNRNGFEQNNINEAFNKNINAMTDAKSGQMDSSTDTKLRARIADLEDKARNLSQQASSTTTAGSSELDELRRQIAELKSAQAKGGQVAKDKLAENLATTIPKTGTPTDSNSGSANILGARSTDTSSGVAGSNSDNKSNNIQANNQVTSDFQGGGSSFSGSRGTSSIGTSGAIKAGTSTGIVLTKAGDVLIDPSKILDNPQEGEIVNLIEQTHGQPFLIRENGILMKVTVALDSKGNPQLANGKPVFKKERLSKDQEKKLAAEVNVPRLLKEVGDPVRFVKLRELLDKSIQRD